MVSRRTRAVFVVAEWKRKPRDFYGHVFYYVFIFIFYFLSLFVEGLVILFTCSGILSKQWLNAIEARIVLMPTINRSLLSWEAKSQ